MEAYGGRCAITGCGVREILDAAHIVAYQGPETNHVRNGLLLRTDIHTLFDLGLLAIDTFTMTVVTDPSLAGSEYASLAGVTLRVPTSESHAPHRTALDRQCERAGLTRR